MTDQSSNAPVDVIRDGALKATIWKNNGENGEFFSTTLSKTFEQNGALQDGHSFTSGDLLRISELSRRAYACIGGLREAAKGNNPSSCKPEPSPVEAPAPK